MYPELPAIGGFALKSYAFCGGLAMFVAIWPVRSEARRLGWNAEAMTWLVFIGTLVGWVGSHLLYMLTRMDLPREDWLRLLPNVGAGSVWYGGFLASWMLFHTFARRHGLPPLTLYDVGALAILPAQAIGRVGCLLGGCCYGVPTSRSWGVAIPNGDHAHLPVHPVPAYEAIFLTVLFVALWRGRAHRQPGYTSALYLVCTALGRLLLEFLRGDRIRGFVWGQLSTSQALALVLLMVSPLLWLVASRAEKCTTRAREGLPAEDAVSVRGADRGSGVAYPMVVRERITQRLFSGATKPFV